MVPPELLIHAQGRKEGLFQNKIAEIDQCEEDEISHNLMMKQRRTFVNLPYPHIIHAVGEHNNPCKNDFSLTPY